MGHQYKAVQWNGNKVVYDLYLFAFIALFVGVFMLVGLQIHDSGHSADPVVLAIVISSEYLGVGLGTAASVAFIARETSKLAVATQFALFTAIAATPRVVASSFSGLIVDNIGWTDFFYLSALLAIPGMVLLVWVAPWNAPVAATDLAEDAV